MKNYTTYITAVAFLMLGLFGGMLIQQGIFQATLVKAVSNMDGVTLNIDLNETLMMDKATENMKEVLWSVRMQNCTRTQKNYCALECYENNKLIPCENFTSDEHFCSEGICERNGICPDYFDKLEGKDMADCINDVLTGDSE